MKNNDRLNALDERFMNIALQEAAKANHKVFPNPKVGALIVAVSYTHLRAHET